MDAITLIQNDPDRMLDELLEHDPRLRSPHSKRAYRHGITTFNKWRGDRPITKSLVLEYMSALEAEGKAAGTINAKVAAIRWYARSVADVAQDYSNDQELADNFSRTAARICTVRQLHVDHGVAGRHILPGEFEALLEACRRDKTPAGARDASIFSLLWATGVRRAELAHINIEDVKKVEDGYEVQIVRGKGGKSRTVHAFGGAAKYLEDWISIRGQEPGRLYWALDKGSKGAKRSRQTTGEALGYVLGKRCAEAQIAEPMTMHDFRRTLAGSLLGAGVDISTVQKILGHSTATMVGFYDRRPLSAQREAIRQIYVPYKPRT